MYLSFLKAAVQSRGVEILVSSEPDIGKAITGHGMFALNRPAHDCFTNLSSEVRILARFRLSAGFFGVPTVAGIGGTGASPWESLFIDAQVDHPAHK